MPDEKIEDRGDEPTQEQLDEAQKLRDTKGRFVKKDETTDEAADGEVGEPEEKEEEEEETPPKKKAPAKKEEEEGEEKEAEGEKEEEEEAEEKEGEEEEEDETPDPTEGKMVTLKRFKEVIKQRKDLQAKLDEEAAAKKETKTTESDVDRQIKAFNDKLDDLYIKVEEARIAEDPKLAAQLQREIDGMNRQISRAEAVATARREAFSVQQNSTYNQMLDYLETVRPILDPDAPEFDKRVVKELTFHVEAYEKMGMPASDALRKACSMIFEQDPFAKDVKKVLKDDETKDDDKKPADKKTDVKKNLAAAKKTPPSHPGRTQEGNGKINVVQLTDEEYDKLPESKKRELRGDAV